MKRKFEKQSQRPLFALNERRHSIRRPTVKSSSSFRKKLLAERSRERAGKNEEDFDESSEMIDLGNVTQDNAKPSGFSTAIPLDSSFSSPHEQMRVMSQGEKYPTANRKYLAVGDSSDQVQRQAPTNRHTASFSSQKSTAVEQDLDFDLEVTVNIESGKCAFHPNSDTKTEHTEPRYLCLTNV